MNSKRIFSIGLSLALTASTTFGISSAQAASAPTLPAGQHLVTVEQYPSLLWSISPSDGASTPVGTHSTSTPGVIQIVASNPASGKVYVIENTDGDLYVDSANETSGAIERVHQILGEVQGEVPYALFFGKTGEAYVVARDNRQYNMWLYSLNLTTGATTQIGDLGSGYDGFLAYSSVDQKVYHYASTGMASTVDLATASQTPAPAHNLNLSANYNCGGGSHGINATAGSFDGKGNLWFLNSACNADLMFATFSNGASTFQGTLFDSAHSVHGTSPYELSTYGIVVTGTVQEPRTSLANTGNGDGTLTFEAILALLAVLAGSMTIAYSRKVKRG
jgi:hypothetical protein